MATGLKWLTGYSSGLKASHEGESKCVCVCVFVCVKESEREMGPLTRMA